MFDELDQLLQLTKLVEATSTNSDTEQKEDDLPATVREYDQDGSGKFKTLTTKSPSSTDTQEIEGVPQPRTDGKAFGSSGNPTFTDQHGNPIDGGPLFEEDGPTVDPNATPDAGTQNSEAVNAAMKANSEANDKVGEAAQELEEPMKQLADAESAESGADTGTANDAPANQECKMNPVGRSLKRGLAFSMESVERGMGRNFVNKYMFESGSACCARNNPFQLGDAVQVAGIPRIFIVKNNDGNMITTAKPTNCEADFAKGKDGVWPEYCFQCNELSKVGNADLSQADELAEFNDRDITPSGFNGLTIDPSPMELAQSFARERTMDDVAEDLDEILGAYRSAASGNDKEFSYTKCSPVTTMVYPNGQVTTQCIEGGFQKMF
ncbi:MAG: hypothetical protein IKA48_02370 [Fibrobacter sp.]|nr:hypothetical protein [Fibrobacter sp.]